MTNKKIKALLLDFDGVLSTGKLFSEIYSENFGIEISTVKKLINKLDSTAFIGKVDLKEMLKSVLEEWKWKGTVEELLEYWFKSDINLNKTLIQYLLTLQKKGIKLFLATNQEKYRAKYIWEKMGLKNWIDEKFISWEMGITKNNPHFFELILKQTNIPSQQIYYFDDNQNNILNAKSVGIEGRVYSSPEDIKHIFLQ